MKIISKKKRWQIEIVKMTRLRNLWAVSVVGSDGIFRSSMPNTKLYKTKKQAISHAKALARKY